MKKIHQPEFLLQLSPYTKESQEILNYLIDSTIVVVVVAVVVMSFNSLISSSH